MVQNQIQHPWAMWGLYSSWRANCQWIWNSLFSLGTWLLGRLPFSSHWLMWQLWFWQWAWCWVKFLNGWLIPLYVIFFNSPLITGNVLYRLLKLYNIHKQSFRILESINHDWLFFQCWNARSRARASPDSAFRPVVYQISSLTSK